jgi:lipoprotein-releasing system permease protein
VHIPVRSLTFPDGHTSGPHIDAQLGSLDGILVGKELAKNLHLYLGQEVEVVSPIGKDSPTGQVLPRVRSFRVAGTFFTGMYEYDVKSVYVSMPALQRFLSLGDEVTGIEIKASDMDATGPLVDTIRQALGPQYRVQDWKELNRSLFSALKLEKFMMFSILAIIILVASFSIVSNLIMVVVEKAREIAILKSMGSSSWAVMRVFVLEGLYMGVLGTVIGILNGTLYCWAIKRFGLPLDPDVYYIDKLPVAMEAAAIGAVTLAGLLISAAATIYPAYVGAQLRPVDGLRNE